MPQNSCFWKAIVADQNKLLNFYSGLGTDDRGRSLRQIQCWPDDQLERTHDYIQWLFPLTERSGFNSNAPILDAQVIQEFLARSELRGNLRASLVRMLAFLGFRLVEDEPLRVVPAAHFAERAKNWLTPANHNHLRRTRTCAARTQISIPNATPRRGSKVLVTV